MAAILEFKMAAKHRHKLRNIANSLYFSFINNQYVKIIVINTISIVFMSFSVFVDFIINNMRILVNPANKLHVT